MPSCYWPYNRVAQLSLTQLSQAPAHLHIRRNRSLLGYLAAVVWLGTVHKSYPITPGAFPLHLSVSFLKKVLPYCGKLTTNIASLPSTVKTPQNNPQ